MQRPSPWLLLVVLLLGIILLREPRCAKMEDAFVAWLLGYSANNGSAVPLTVVEIGRDALMDPQRLQAAEAEPPQPGDTGAAISPLEFALFLQSVLDFQPGVIAFENILKWRERDKDQEQVFLDQAMRVPKLLLASQLGATDDPDASWAEIRGFSQVVGKRGELAPFTGIERRPGEDLRLISTPGFVNLPEGYASSIRVPLLFLYRGEVIPSFPLQAILLWLRITPAEVKVVLGSHLELPEGRRIPLATDGTLLIDPSAEKRARRVTLNELLLAAQQRETAPGEGHVALDLSDQIVLARTPANPLSPSDVFAATIATIEGNKYLHRISRLFDCAVLLVIAAALPWLRRMARLDLVLCGIGVTAAYCLVALGTLSRWSLWLPGVLPLGALWIAIVAACFFRAQTPAVAEAAVAPPPPIV
ncbi:MAG: hypothetical protein ACR2ID_05435 [Chthoniobacterales bacterium]